MKFRLNRLVVVLMLLVGLGGPELTHAADRLMFLKGSTVLGSSIDAMMALPGGGIVSGVDVYRGFTRIPFLEDDLLVHNLDNSSFAVYRDSAYFRSGVFENATPFELFVHMPPQQLPVSLYEYESLYGETTLDNLLSLPGVVVFYDLIPFAAAEPGPDTTPPLLNLPASITVDATSDQGYEVNFSVSATDNADSNPVVGCVPASGTLFSIGVTTVICTATDDSNNTAQGSFTVTVNPLLVFGPVTDDSSNTAPGSFAVTGTLFSSGVTTVVCTATDDSNNTAQGSFTVTVDPLPVTPVPCDVDDDNDVDIDDIRAIVYARNAPALPGDPRDSNGDGIINLIDSRQCVSHCTNARCVP